MTESTECRVSARTIYYSGKDEDDDEDEDDGYGVHYVRPNVSGMTAILRSK